MTTRTTALEKAEEALPVMIRAAHGAGVRVSEVEVDKHGTIRLKLEGADAPGMSAAQLAVLAGKS